MSTCCVNKSGTTVPVYNFNDVKIGELTPNEFFSLIGSEGSLYSIYFLGPSGTCLNGVLRNSPSGTVTSIERYPYRTTSIYGTSYKTYYMRKTMSLYNVNGTVIGSVAANKQVACLTGLGGATMPYLKAINYYQNSAGTWIPITYGDYNYGFVDTGMRTSSSRSGIALYGSW